MATPLCYSIYSIRINTRISKECITIHCCYDILCTALFKVLFHVPLLYFEHLPLQRSLHGPDTHTHTHTHSLSLTTVHSVSHTARSRRLEGKLHDQPPTAKKHTPSLLYTQNSSHLPNSAFHNIESIGSVRGFRARFASQLVQFGASERVSRVNWFSSGLQSTFCESFDSVRGFRARFASQLVQFVASERVSRVI